MHSLQPLLDGRWHFVSLAWDVATTATLYIDGEVYITFTIPSGQHQLLAGGMFVLGQVRICACEIFYFRARVHVSVTCPIVVLQSCSSATTGIRAACLFL